MPSRDISIGFLLVPLQTLDMVGPMDILFNISYNVVASYTSPDVAERLSAPKITFHYIGPTMEATMTSGMLRILPTATVKDCPKLDYLLVGGPAPDYAHNVPQDLKKFMLERSKEVKTIFTTCTGGLVLSSTGLLDDLEATTNHALIDPHGQQIAPKVRWSAHKNWIVSENGRFWTAAGAGAGMDMMAEWVRQEFSQDLLNICTTGLEWQPRDVDGKAMTYMNGRMEIVEV